MTFTGEYGVSRSFEFPLYGADDNGVDTAVCVAGDIKISKDGGAFANTTNLFASSGSWIYSITLTAAEMRAGVIRISIIDQSGAVWKDLGITIRTNKAI